MMLRTLTVLVAAGLLPFVQAQVPQASPAGGVQPSGQAPQSQAEVLKMIEQRIQSARELKQRGRIQEASQLLSDAQRVLETITQADPHNIQARVLSGELLMEGNDYNSARKVFLSVIEDEPGNFRANLGLGKFYIASRLWRQAAAYLENARKVAPSDRLGEVLRLLAQAYGEQGKRKEAIDTAQQAVSIEPDNLEALTLLVQIYLQSEQPDQAVEQAEKLVAAARQAREADLSDRKALQNLVSAYQTQVQALGAYYRSLCRLDARGRPTDQILPGNEAEAVETLRQVAYVSERIAKLNWELSYHGTLALIEPVPGLQPDEVRARIENNTGYLMLLADLLRTTHQDQRALEIYQRITQITDPTDPDPQQAKRNQQLAAEYMEAAGRQAVTQPAQAPASP